jgi:fatty acid desaturase
MNRTKRGRDYTLPFSTYEMLRAKVAEQGCFNQTIPAFVASFIIGNIGVLVIAAIVVLSDSLWIQIVNGIFAGFVTMQIGLLGHDLSHNSVFRNARHNQICSSILLGLWSGLSESRWSAKHNAHHQSPNHIGHDPDVDIPFVFDHDQAATQSTFHRKYFLPYQHWLFWIGIWFVYPRNILLSMQYIFHHMTLRTIFEVALIVIHFILVFGFTFWHLPPLVAIVFNIVTILSLGVYMAMIFAPNHKGEDMLDPSQTHNWVHQITLTRNIIPAPGITLLFGGLNYQIEHHLFPDMSRINYPKARPIVKTFCFKHHIPYKETTWRESLREIHYGLKQEAQKWQ